MSNNIAHLMQIILISKKYFAVVNGEYATISDFADLPRREQFYIASTGIEICNYAGEVFRRWLSKRKYPPGRRC